MYPPAQAVRRVRVAHGASVRRSENLELWTTLVRGASGTLGDRGARRDCERCEHCEEKAGRQSDEEDQAELSLLCHTRSCPGARQADERHVVSGRNPGCQLPAALPWLVSMTGRLIDKCEV
jgi:hypothetical protein